MKQYSVKDIMNGVEDVDKESRKVKAVWARMSNVDLDNDIISPAAFTKTINERGPQGKNLIWSLVDHKTSMKYALGKPKELYVEGDALIAVTEVIETEMGEDMLKLYEAGLINQHSIGFSTIKSEMDNSTGIRTITELMLYEGSAVLWAANPETPTISIYKGMDAEVVKETLNGRLEKLIKAFKHGTFTDETFSLLEIEIKQIQTAINEITTQPAAKAVEPESTVVLDALKQLNNRLKLVK
ncbi:MAG: HK97 family phage prohead protease [Chitinophagaceae bacterium]|jgi:HK97 family phage prohead protease|nr:HK97 family phage prohead protease [Chitinophagaceae bacterium]